jgi:hypothetical protein
MLRNDAYLMVASTESVVVAPASIQTAIHCIGFSQVDGGQRHCCQGGEPQSLVSASFSFHVPNGPRISCGDFAIGHYLTFLTPEVPVSCMRLLGRDPWKTVTAEPELSRRRCAKKVFKRPPDDLRSCGGVSWQIAVEETSTIRSLCPLDLQSRFTTECPHCLFLSPLFFGRKRIIQLNGLGAGSELEKMRGVLQLDDEERVRIGRAE